MGTERLPSSTCLNMVILSIEEEEEVEVDENGLTERPLERPNGGFGREFSHGNGRRTGGDICQITSERDQQDRWEEEWSLPTRVERREEGISIR